MIRRLHRLLHVLRVRGVGYALYLVTGYLWPRLGRWMLFESPYSALFQRIFARFSPHRAPVIPTRGRENTEEDVVLGRLDNDGRLLSFGGSLPGLDEVDEESFVERYRFDLDVVRRGDQLLLRKNYRGNRGAFLREWRGLVTLDGQGGCPAVHDVDEQALVLYKSFVPGQTLRQHLVRAGAQILSVDTESDAELTGLSARQRIEAVWARGRAVFDKVFAPPLPEDFLTLLEGRLDALHRRGVTGFSLSFGNVVLHQETGEPWFIDFDAAVTHGNSSSLVFALGRDRDRELFNRIYGRELLTERTARALLKKISTQYSPVDLGRGLAHRGFWSIDSGTGRWEVLNRRVLGDLIQGARILDLGTFQGLMPLLMLSAGARQVVALEKMPENVETGRHLRRLFEWRDMRSLDMDLRCADMREILSPDWDTFDIVTAFCSLYYLSEHDMARVVRRAAEIAPILVLQAKTDTRPEADSDKAKKSSLSFLHALLEQHGFPTVEIMAPAGFTRPLLIGRRQVDPVRDS